MICIPSHDGRVSADTFYAVYGALLSGARPIFWMHARSSLLTYNCNKMLAQTLDLKKELGLRYFVLLHSDIIPIEAEKWLEMMIGEMEKGPYDLITAISPLKSAEELTSTAWRIPIKDDKGNRIGNELHRMSFDDYKRLPATFTKEILQQNFDLPEDFDFIMNTALMVVDLDSPFMNEPDRQPVCFHTNDFMIRDRNGKHFPVCESEDWFFTQMAQNLGARVAATQKVRLFHEGVWRFASWESNVRQV